MTMTTDLTEFGFIELKALERLLRYMREQGLPDDFNKKSVHVMLNKNSGYVFLTNEDFQVAMINEDKLETFYHCPSCGHEGFKQDMLHDEDAENPDCQEYLTTIGAEDCDHEECA
jgi:hypothetical protein